MSAARKRRVYLDASAYLTLLLDEACPARMVADVEAFELRDLTLDLCAALTMPAAREVGLPA